MTILLALHGHGVHLSLGVAPVAAVVRRMLGPILEELLPGEPEVRGAIRTYAEPEVLRHVSPNAVRLEDADPLLELYRDAKRPERFWLVDERWGICELDLLRRSFVSWILPAPTCDAVRTFESAVLWPMAQLLRGSGLHLIPAAAVGREGRGVLLLSPFDIGPELAALARQGVGIIGQRWVALREERDGKIALLSVPGCSETTPAPRPLSAGPMGQPLWSDIAAGCECRQATTQLVLLVEPMRRTGASVRPLTEIAARQQIKRLWPLPQLSAGQSPTVATNMLAAKLARVCSVHCVCLSRNGNDLARLLVAPTPAVAA